MKAILRLFNGSKTKESWNENSPEFIDDWKPEEKLIPCDSVQITYRDHIKVYSEKDNGHILDLYWTPDYFIEHEGVFYGDIDIFYTSDSED